MTTAKSVGRPGAPLAGCVMGGEREFAFAPLDTRGNRLSTSEGVKLLMREVKRIVPCLPCSGDLDVFTGNGSRVYVDVGNHPEVATPECTTPEEVVRFTRAGDHLLALAARAVERAWPGGDMRAMLWTSNVDQRTGATWASHESYLHTAPQSLFADQLITHLVTRIVYTGAGGFDNRAPALRFVISPRAFHLERVVSGNSMGARGIFHTRDEPLAAAPYRRLHVLAGESLWSETADYLRFGTTALLVAQVEASRRPQTGLDLESPLQALRTIAADVSGTATVAVRPSGRLSAIAIQRRLLEGVEADLGADHLPAWASSVCERWRAVLDRLEASPTSLVGVLDWPIKLAVLQRHCKREGIEWTFTGQRAAGIQRPSTAAAARLLETDMHFSRLDESGIFATLDREGALAHRIVPTVATERAVHEPPSSGRARIRAAWVKRLSGQSEAICCHWDRIIDRKHGKRLWLGDPFQSEGATWKPLPR